MSQPDPLAPLITMTEEQLADARTRGAYDSDETQLVTEIVAQRTKVSDLSAALVEERQRHVARWYQQDAENAALRATVERLTTALDELRTAVMVEVSDPYHEWPTARAKLTRALNAALAPDAQKDTP